MKLSELKNHINERQINFVAFCMTPWHLVGAKACCYYLKDCGKIVNPIFIALPHFSNGYLLKENIEDNICYLDNDISVTIKNIYRSCLNLLLEEQIEMLYILLCLGMEISS